MIMIASGASRGAFGVFFKPMTGDLGWSSAEISGPFSFSMLVEGVVNFFTGWLLDRFGTRIVLVGSGLISGLGFILISQVEELWQMYLIYGFAMGIGLGGLMVPILSIMAKRFTSHMSFMTGIALGANGLGQLISPLIAYQLITRYNWHTSYIIMGIVVLILIVFSAQFLKSSRSKRKEIPTVDHLQAEKSPVPDSLNFTFSEARHTGTFYLVVLMLTCYVYCFLSILVHIVPCAIEIGIPASTAANVLACASGATIIGRLLLGAVADRIGNKRMIAIGYSIMLLAFLGLTQANEEWSIFLSAIVCGFGLGGVSSSQSPIVAKFFGAKYHGTIFGTIAGIMVVLGSGGPFATGYLFDLTGRYQIPFLVCSLFSAAALILCLALKPPQKPSAGNTA
jgi:MFS family permease